MSCTHEPTTIAFLGTKEIGYKCFESLVALKDILNLRIVAVLTNGRKLFTEGKTLRELAIEMNIPVFEDLNQLIAGPDIDLIISVQYHQILKPAHIAKAKRIAVNYHMAPLPEYRGCNQFSFAIVNGDKVFGTTLHRLENGIDSGDILAEKRFPIPENSTVFELYDLTFARTVELFKETVPLLVSGEYQLKSQASFLAARGTSIHLRKEIEELKRIDLDWPAEKILRHLRATSMPGFPPPTARLGPFTVKLLLEKSDSLP